MRANYKAPEGRRILAKPAKTKKKRSPIKTLGLVLYGILVAISAIIVAVYLYFTFFVKYLTAPFASMLG